MFSEVCEISNVEKSQCMNREASNKKIYAKEWPASKSYTIEINPNPIHLRIKFCTVKVLSLNHYYGSGWVEFLQELLLKWKSSVFFSFQNDIFSKFRQESM